MQEMHIRHQDLTTAEVRSSHLHRLHRVTLFPPLSAILRRAVKSSFRMIAA
ncbi:putative transcriptional regulator, partial [Salmonella enterica subsp. enterica serovar Heidelberg str. 579083-10]